MNTTFTILKADENGDMLVLFTEIRRNNTRIPFSLKCAFQGMLGEEVRFERWTEGETEATVLGRGGKINAKFL